MKRAPAYAALLLLTTSPAAAQLPDGYWPADRSRPILDATLVVTLDPDLSALHATESAAIAELLAAGAIVQELYERQRHDHAHDALLALQALHDRGVDVTATRNLLDLYYLFQGPVATTLDNARLPFLPVANEQAGKNVYPAGLTRADVDEALAAAPGLAASITATRTIVRRGTVDNIDADLERLRQFPAVAELHAGLVARLEVLRRDPPPLYAVPYALAYAAELREARAHLERAAALVAEVSPDFAAYLRNRGRDLLSGDYESGDASWVSGEFGNLNLQFGSYETYDDVLLGAKAFYSASVLVRDRQKSDDLAAAIGELQSIENALPYDHAKRVQSQIPVGVYNVVADFGQSRGANTATILPNDADHARKYGRTVLIRNNILTNPEIFANSKRRFDAAVDPDYREHLTVDGGFNRTLWHEIGHYLGVSVTADGRDLDAALGEYANLLEEMKSDLVSLFAAQTLRSIGYHDDDGLRAQYADGIRRTLQVVRPRPEQPYQNMQLMQFNFFLEHGLIAPNPDSGLLTIDYERYHDVITALLREVLQLQYAGDRGLARDFITRWNYWDDRLHGVIAERMQQGEQYRRTMVRYAILDDRRAGAAVSASPGIPAP